MTAQNSDPIFVNWLSHCHGRVVEADGSEAMASLPLELDASVVEQLSAATSCLEQLESYRRWRTAGITSSIDGAAAAELAAAAQLPSEWDDDERLEQLGRFRIERELGRGGQAIVYLATDPLLGRPVALKVLRPEFLLSKSMRKRFLREAQVTARLTHPHILSVYETGEVGPLLYIASVYCSGPTLQQWLAARSEKVPQHLAAQIVRRLADAADYAHQQGVLHRDIKPGNVFLEMDASGFVPLADEAGTAAERGATPKLGDFGMAHIEQGDGLASLDATRTGALVGTPAYMAPEQALGQQHRTGPATDVYALGLVLHELLTGEPAFRGGTQADTLRRVLQDEPPRPSQRRRDVSADLEAICRCCLEKEPEKRYPSARELADDLQRFTEGQPTRARPLSPPARLLRWCKRHPAAASLWGVVAASAVTLVALMLASNVLLRQERDRTEMALNEARANESRAQQLLYASDIERAQQARMSNEAGQARELLAQYIPQAGDEDVRELGWHFLWNSLHREQRRLPRHPGDVYGLAFSPDGRLLATACIDGKVRVWNYASGELLRVLDGHDGEVNVVGFSPDGARLASGGDDGIVVIWNVADGAEISRLEHYVAGGDCWITGLAFASEGRRLVAAAEGDVCVWDVNTATLLDQATLLDHTFKDFCLSPDEQLVGVSHGGNVWVYRIDDWTEVAHLHRANTPNNSQWGAMRFAADSASVYVGSERGNLSHYDLATHKRIGQLAAPSMLGISCLDVSPDQTLIAFGAVDGVVGVAQSEGENTRAEHLAHTGRVWGVRFAPDRESWASAGADGEVMIWPSPQHLEHHDERGLMRFPLAGRTATALAYLPDGRQLVYGIESDGAFSVECLDRTGQTTRSFPTANEVRQFAVSRDGRFIVYVTEIDHDVLVIDVDTGETRLLGRLPDYCNCLTISPRGIVLLSAALSREVLLHDLYSGQDLEPLRPFDETVNAAAFSPDGDRLILTGVGHGAIYETKAWTQVAHFGKPGDDFRALTCFPDGQRFACAEGRGGLTIRDAQSGEVLDRYSGHLGAVRSVAVSPDGRTIASNCDLHRLLVWDLRTGRSVLSFDDLRIRIGQLAFSPAGDELSLAEIRPGDNAFLLDARPQN